MGLQLFSNNIFNIYKESSLEVAIQEGHLDVVELLLEYNCDTWNKGKDTDHDSPLLLALERLNALARLNTHRSNQYEVVELLPHNKCDPNICNKDEQSPLHVAVEQRNMKVIILLLQGNANPNLQDKEGRTPLHIALEADDTESDDTDANVTEAVKLLLEHGANP